LSQRKLIRSSSLVGNAIKFTQHGCVALSCRLVDFDEETEISTLEFCVADTGIGIKPDKLNLIFDTFAQADGSTTRVGGSRLNLVLNGVHHSTEIWRDRPGSDNI